MNRRRVHLLAAAALPWLAPRPAAAAVGGRLEIFPDPWILLALIALFLLLVYPLHVLLFRPLLGVLDERRARIQGARERAERVGADAQTILERVEAAAAKARAEAEHDRRETLDGARRDQTAVLNEARGEAESQTARARREVAEALEDARRQLRQEAEPLAREAASRLLGRSVA